MTKNKLCQNWLSNKEIYQIETWTNWHFNYILFDSDVDNWKINESVFNKNITGKNKLLFVIETFKGEKFGVYYAHQFSSQYYRPIQLNKESFFFTLNMPNNNKTCQIDNSSKYYGKAKKYNQITLFEEDDERLLHFNNIIIMKENDISGNYIKGEREHQIHFQFKHLQQHNKFIIPKKILVYQMGNSIQQVQQIQKEIESKNQRRQTTFQLLQQKTSSFIKLFDEWTGLQCKEVIFDSEIDNWAIETSTLNNRICGKKQLIFMIQDTDCEIFGYYLSCEINQTFNSNSTYYISNDQTFEFNIQTKNKRLKQPIKFGIEKRCEKTGYVLFNDFQMELITLGDIHLFKQNFASRSYCENNQHLWKYEGENMLCGKSMNTVGKGNYFIPKRIIIIQMG